MIKEYNILKKLNGHELKKPVPVFDIKDFTNEDLYIEQLLLNLPNNYQPQTIINKRLQDFDSFRVTKEKHVPDTTAFITLGEAKVAAACNITPITAESKAGKTAVVNVIIAGAISKDGNVDGFTGMNVLPNPYCKGVIHIDTEQSEADQQHNQKTSLRRGGEEVTPDYLGSYNIRTLNQKDYREFTNTICKLYSDEFGGLHCIIIDGAADYITSVNDEAEANAIITYFTSLAVEFNCPVILVVHLNENAGKNSDTMPRGHIGRQAVRKGYCQLNITKDGDISTMQALRARKAGVDDTPVICYQYCKTLGYHISVDPGVVAESKQKYKDLSNRIKAEAIANKIFALPNSFTHTEAVSKIANETSKSESTSKRYLKEMVYWEIIKKGDDGNYKLNDKYNSDDLL
jgi:hypothetical protein